MKKKIIALIGFSLLNMPTSNAAPNSKEYQWHAGAGIGFNGFNITAGYKPMKDSFIGKRLGFRLDYNTVGSSFIDTKVKVDDTHYDLDTSSYNIGFLVDFYLFEDAKLSGNNLRFSLGYYHGEIELDGSEARSSGEVFRIGNHDYRFSGTSGRTNIGVEWDISGFYIGIGAMAGFSERWKFYTDLGWVFANLPEMDVKHGTSNLEIDDGGWADVSTQMALYREDIELAEDSLDDSANDLNVKDYPIIRLGILYRF